MALEEYLDLWIWTFDFTRDARILPIVLQKNNLRPMYEKLPHGEQARWWAHAERHDILDQAVLFQRYIRARYQGVATLASQAAITCCQQGWWLPR
jgi:hypothetical protein